MPHKQTLAKPTPNLLRLTKGRSIDIHKITDRDYREALIYGLIRMLDEPDLIAEQRRQDLEALIMIDIA